MPKHQQKKRREKITTHFWAYQKTQLKTKLKKVTEKWLSNGTQIKIANQSNHKKLLKKSLRILPRAIIFSQIRTKEENMIAAWMYNKSKMEEWVQVELNQYLNTLYFRHRSNTSVQYVLRWRRRWRRI